ncbi:MAG: FAD-dependent oxidoreductase [Chloroflexota bacterium]|nr:FAD-dependent oxidoreductase [Chloroflexota bacterium]
MKYDYDLIAIGGGTAGLTATTAAVGFGLSAALIEKHRIGGDCTWTGCVPSKALIRAARAAHETRTAARFGILVEPPRVDMAAVRAHVRASIETIYQHETPDALGKQGVTVIPGTARFIDPRTIQVGERRLTARRFLITTGASPIIPAIAGLADVPYHTYETIFDLETLPASLAIVGAGSVGTELAQAYQRLGAQVTLIGETLLPKADADARAVLETVFAREGVLRIRASADRVSRDGDRIVVHAGAERVSADVLLIAVGRAPTVQGLDLEAAGVAYSADGITVDTYLRTNQRHIYAAGDCIGRAQYTHYAGWAAFRALQNAFLPVKVKTDAAQVPWTVFTDPEVAQVGMSEAAARAEYGDKVGVQLMPMDRTDRAITDGAIDGFIKVIHTGSARVVGAVVVAPRAGEVINEFALALDHEPNALNLAGTIHTYPTYSTAAQLAEAAIVTRWMLNGMIGRIVRWAARRGR